MQSALEFLWTWGPLLLVIGGWWFFAWYFGRKVEKAKANAPEPLDGPPGTLTLVRAIDGTNYLRKFAVLIDDAKVGYIRSGEVRHFPVSPGMHRVAVKIDFCKSRELTVDTHKGKNRRLNCGSTYNDWRCLYMWLLKPRDFVYVRTEV
jgi:hypothetical protein